ncbi:hypothetical protein Tco_0930863 [Tanacetum coccineum]
MSRLIDQEKVVAHTSSMICDSLFLNETIAVGGVGRGVKEKQGLIADKSFETSKHVNVVNAGLESFPTVSEVHGIHSPAGNEENMIDAGTTVGPTQAGNTLGMSSYANVTGKPSGTKVNFRTLFTPGGNGIDVVVPVESIRAISERFANTTYVFFGKRVAYPVVANYVRNTWGKYGLVRSMFSSSTGLFSFQFRSMDGLDAMLENVWVKLHGVPVTVFSEDGLSDITTKLGQAMLEL